MNLGLFTLFTILILSIRHPSPIPFYIFTLFAVLFGSSATALIQYASFGLAGRYGPLYTQALMTGQGLSGMFPPIASIVSGTSSSSSNIAAGIFFACSGGLTAIALITFLFLKRITPKESAVRIPADASVEMLNERTTIDKPLEMLKRMGIFPWAIAGVFLVTLAAFPSLTSAIVSTHVFPPPYNPDNRLEKIIFQQCYNRNYLFHFISY
jgi:solute carrier family 29 (equilibrative nucleoside transporter), member 1/2/3